MTIILSLFIAAHIFCATDMQPYLERELQSLRISSPEVLDTENHIHYEQSLPNNETVTWYITESFPDTFEDYAPGMHIFLSPPDKAYDISEAYKKDKYASKPLDVLMAVYKTELSEQVARITSLTVHNAWVYNSISVHTALDWECLPIGFPSTPQDLSASACALDDLDLTLLQAPAVRRMHLHYPFPHSTERDLLRTPYFGLSFRYPHTLVLTVSSDHTAPIRTIELFKEDSERYVHSTRLCNARPTSARH